MTVFLFGEIKICLGARVAEFWPPGAIFIFIRGVNSRISDIPVLQKWLLQGVSTAL